MLCSMVFGWIGLCWTSDVDTKESKEMVSVTPRLCFLRLQNSKAKASDAFVHLIFPDKICSFVIIRPCLSCRRGVAAVARMDH